MPVSHRALAYGDGLFETLYVDQNGPHYLPDHLSRLLKGVETLLFAWSENSTENLKNDIAEICRGISTPHVLKIMLLRNCPGRGYDFDPQLQTTDVVLQLADYQKPAWTAQGAKVVTSNIRINESCTLAGLKHLNRLDSVLARQFARTHEAHEALLLDSDNNVIEGSMSNIFIKIDGAWLTPSLKSAGVAGIFRKQIIRQNKITETNIAADKLAFVEAAALTNSLIGLVPITELDGRTLPIETYLNYSWGL